MTREEIKKAMRDTKKEVVLKNLHKLLSLVEGYSEYEDCVGYAIETLEQEPIEKCKWIKYDHRTMCPKEHIDVDSPYWRIPENRMEALKYCPYCGKEIEVEE